MRGNPPTQAFCCTKKPVKNKSAKDFSFIFLRF